jgi:purine-binding chemotaxis protein CheW
MMETTVRSGSLASRMLIVRLGEELHALPVCAIEEVLPALPIGKVPHCPGFIRGVIFVRGHLIPVLDAAERLGLAGHDASPDPNIICLRINDQLVGILVDEALDLVDLRDTQQLSITEIGGQAGFCRSVVDYQGEIIRILDPELLLGSDEAATLNHLPQTAPQSPFSFPG